MRLLVVEDDPDLNRQLVSALTEAGHAVDVDARGSVFLTGAFRKSADFALIMDYSLKKGFFFRKLDVFHPLRKPNTVIKV